MHEMIRLQRASGITKFKCATIAEVEMAAEAGVADLLLAYQPVGPNVHRTVELVRRFPQTKFSIICDDAEAIRTVSETMQSAFGFRGNGPKAGPQLDVLLDIDVGQHRTGVAPGAKAGELYQLIANLPGLKPGGLHAYDGHITHSDPAERARCCESAFAPVAALRKELINAGLPVPTIVAGGTPTFRMHAAREDVECSPGTCVFWDAGYAAKLPDLEFLQAALVLTRVVSKPGSDRLCLDLGHKAIAAEMPPPRATLLGLEDAKPVMHSEEHLVVETGRADDFKAGDCIYGVPWHICPTVALYSAAVVIENGKIVGTWRVTRDRLLTI
jgi:D-serine deaminase-like pyridoxal phosphate-dependent protein